ncbi:MAG: hypothetical protein WA061_05730 [Microgenomates group bacterium]
MHALIISTAKSPTNIPSSLLPMKGRAVIDLLISDILNQKEVSKITIYTTSELLSIHQKHFSNSFPVSSIELTTDIDYIKVIHEDLLVCEGKIYSSLKMQDFIQAFRQFKRITTASFKAEDKELYIPYFVVPQSEANVLLEYPAKTNGFTLTSFHAWLEAKNIPPYVFKSGTGFCVSL